jgi:hypothetical protein
LPIPRVRLGLIYRTLGGKVYWNGWAQIMDLPREGRIAFSILKLQDALTFGARYARGKPAI